MSRSQPSVPQNVTLAGDRVFGNSPTKVTLAILEGENWIGMDRRKKMERQA